MVAFSAYSVRRWVLLTAICGLIGLTVWYLSAIPDPFYCEPAPIRVLLRNRHEIEEYIQRLKAGEGPAQVLVDIRDWDYNWQESYFFRAPIAVKAGTRFDIEAHYDNSAKNPRNPNKPPRFVKFGEQTTDEMCFGFIGATSDKPGRIRRKMQAPKKPEK